MGECAHTFRVYTKFGVVVCDSVTRGMWSKAVDTSVRRGPQGREEVVVPDERIECGGQAGWQVTKSGNGAGPLVCCVVTYDEAPPRPCAHHLTRELRWCECSYCQRE